MGGERVWGVLRNLLAAGLFERARWRDSWASVPTDRVGLVGVMGWFPVVLA